MDALLLLELTEKLNDALAALDAAVATDDPLALLDATDQVAEVLAEMDGEPAPSGKDFREILNGIISGQIDTFQNKGELQKLSDALDAAGGDSLPAGEMRDLFEQAIRAAGIQQLKGYGYLDAAA